jgi:hypothetical protein
VSGIWTDHRGAVTGRIKTFLVCPRTGEPPTRQTGARRAVEMSEPPNPEPVMPHVHLPAQHTDDDLALAGALATMLRSKELYVAWSVETGQAAPVIPAALQDVRDDEPRSKRRPGLLARWFGR